MSARDATESIQQLLHSLEKLGPQLATRDGDLQFLRDMLNSNEFQSIMTVHQEVSRATALSAPPSSLSASVMANMVLYDAEEGTSHEEQELFQLLSSPHIGALISTHDRVANKEYPLQSVITVETEAEGGPQSEEKPTRIVRIDKHTDPLGATVRCERDGSIVISRVLCGGAADRSGVVHPGDVLHEINGVSVRGKTIDEVADIMKDLVGSVAFKITPALGEPRPRRYAQPRVHIRTFFSYDPQQDRHHPCKEAGLGFERGSILRVVNQDDPDWWQAVREGERRERAGLIPSKTYKERLVCYDIHGNQTQPQRRQLKGKKRQYSSFDSEKFGSEIVTYEEMVKIEPQVEKPRPMLLMAPRGRPFDVNDLRNRLLQEHPDLFDKAVTHTSRPPRTGERNGQHYHFVSRQQMEREIRNNRFVEHGFLDGNYYGTSIDSIRNVINSGKTCLLTLVPESMKVVRIPELKPFIIYLRPPSLGHMRQNWVAKGLIRESQIADIVRQSSHLERSYSHYFDHHLTFTDTPTVVQEVVGVANRLQTDQQWVPATWTASNSL